MFRTAIAILGCSAFAHGLSSLLDASTGLTNGRAIAATAGNVDFGDAEPSLWMHPRGNKKASSGTSDLTSSKMATHMSTGGPSWTRVAEVTLRSRSSSAQSSTGKAASTLIASPSKARDSKTFRGVITVLPASFSAKEVLSSIEKSTTLVSAPQEPSVGNAVASRNTHVSATTSVASSLSSDEKLRDYATLSGYLLEIPHAFGSHYMSALSAQLNSEATTLSASTPTPHTTVGMVTATAGVEESLVSQMSSESLGSPSSHNSGPMTTSPEHLSGQLQNVPAWFGSHYMDSLSAQQNSMFDVPNISIPDASTTTIASVAIRSDSLTIAASLQTTPPLLQGSLGPVSTGFGANYMAALTSQQDSPTIGNNSNVRFQRMERATTLFTVTNSS